MKFGTFQRQANLEQISKCLQLLNTKDKKKLRLAILINSVLSILDLIGVALVGLIGVIAVQGVTSQAPGTRTLRALDIFHFQNFTLQQQTAFLGIAAASIMISRTLLSIFFTKRILFFLSRRSSEIAKEQFKKLMSQELLITQASSSQEVMFALSTGVSLISLGVIGVLLLAISDAVLLLIMFLGLLIVNPVMALGTTIFFSIAGFILFKVMATRSRELGIQQASLGVDSNKLIQETILVYREILVGDRRSHYVEKFEINRDQAARVQAEVTFMPNISKYFLEALLIIGAISAGAAQFLFQDAGTAVATLSVFLAAGFRIAPAVMRIQQNAIAIQGALGGAETTLKLIETLAAVQCENTKQKQALDFEHEGFTPEVEINNLYFAYPNKNKDSISDVNLRIKPGTFTAIVGPSGAGKSTLLDLILGVHKPRSGEVLISKLAPRDAASKWRGAMSYMPQEVFLNSGSIRENIALGLPVGEIDGAFLTDALHKAHLLGFIESLPEGMDTNIGDGGFRMSGGQRQRLGISRALLSRPKLIMLDEATSALDSEAEEVIASSLKDLRGFATLVVVAHRLSTVRHADQVVYLDNGKIEAVGTFEEVRQKIPNFDNQANLLGL
jgi:ABC-type multidrug transport system fused ATPase/permease subunit